MKNKKKLIKNLLTIGLIVYASFTLINQQKTLNQYEKNRKEVAAQIQEQQEYKEDLAKKKEDVDSLEFIEQTAREKLDMYYPNERVYIDKGM